jgi:hypothetical protein
VRLDQFFKRLDRLRVSIPNRRCECPREPAKPINEDDPDIKVLPPIDLPCGVCGGVVSVCYVLRVIRTEDKKADLPAEDRPAGEAAVG